MINYQDLTKDKYSTGDIAKLTGQTYTTVYNHYKDGKIEMVQDKLNKRFYADKEQVVSYLKFKGVYNENSEKRVAVIYCRVSSQDQQKHGDLDRQVGIILQKIAKQENNKIEVITDVGSGLNTHRRGLLKLINSVMNNEVSTVYITNPDRLTRFGYEYLDLMFNHFNTKIITVVEKEELNANEELVNDMMSLLASFSGKFYGLRSAERKRLRKDIDKYIPEE